MPSIRHASTAVLNATAILLNELHGESEMPKVNVWDETDRRLTFDSDPHPKVLDETDRSSLEDVFQVCSNLKKARLLMDFC